MAAPLGFVGALLIAAKVARGVSRKRKQDEIMEEYRKGLAVPLEQALQVRDGMITQMEIGLRETGSKQGLLMLPSYIDILPTGAERGDFFAIDLGGTNLRVAYVKLGSEKGSTESSSIREWLIPEECYDTDNGRLLDWVAERTIEFAQEHGRLKRDSPPPTIGFCFSFAVDQTAMDNGKLLLWTKIPVILNDTVSTLIARRYSEPDTALGIILGTGTNCAYLERIDRIPKPPSDYRGRSSEMIINSEWGDFKGACLPALPEDLWVDCSSVNPGHGGFEKMISGLYMGEVSRRLVLRLAEHGLLFGSEVPPGLTVHDPLASPLVAAIVGDGSPNLALTASSLASAFGITKSSLDQRRKVKEVCLLVTRRGARLCAAGIAAVLKHTGRGCGGADQPAKRTVIAVDGSVFKKFAKFRELLRAALEEFCGADAAQVELKLQEDGSVFGGAYIAAAASSWTSRASSGS
uniref:Phosphotransferase n=1 Tax=Parachlorella kessleri TaxID=3074 RepID=W0GD47_PARKE|nr:hexokinase 2 [Parachlorella kessleri]